jgi:hypothetical protein
MLNKKTTVSYTNSTPKSHICGEKGANVALGHTDKGL